MYKHAVAALMAILLSASPSMALTLKASWYGPGFQGKRMANGHAFNMNALTVAHRSYEFGTRLHLTNPRNGRTVCATVTDRGPYVRGRQLDVSKAVAVRLGFINAGTANLTVVKNGC